MTYRTLIIYIIMLNIHTYVHITCICWCVCVYMCACVCVCVCVLKCDCGSVCFRFAPSHQIRTAVAATTEVDKFDILWSHFIKSPSSASAMLLLLLCLRR